MLRLLRVMFPYMLLVCLAAALIGGQRAGISFVPALGSVLLNVVMIASVLPLAPRMGNTLRNKSWPGHRRGVRWPGAGFFQLPSLSRKAIAMSGSRHGAIRWSRSQRKMLPGSIGVAAFQINVLLTQTCSFCSTPRSPQRV
jgi:peptidoglycan biosynthesis protein MviN/MurJ (putative lipid II flippase)